MSWNIHTKTQSTKQLGEEDSPCAPHDWLVLLSLLMSPFKFRGSVAPWYSQQRRLVIHVRKCQWLLTHSARDSWQAIVEYSQEAGSGPTDCLVQGIPTFSLRTKLSCPPAFLKPRYFIQVLSSTMSLRRNNSGRLTRSFLFCLVSSVCKALKQSALGLTRGKAKIQRKKRKWELSQNTFQSHAHQLAQGMRD